MRRTIATMSTLVMMADSVRLWSLAKVARAASVGAKMVAAAVEFDRVVRMNGTACEDPHMQQIIRVPGFMILS